MSFTTESVFNSVMGAIGLNDDINKGNPRNANDAQDDKPEYESSLDDEEILELVGNWKSDFENYSKQIESWQKDNERYWLGNQYNPIEQAGTTKRALVDNAIFEALETFLPLATQTNPDPVVACDNTPPGQELADKVRQALVFQADKQTLRMLLKPLVRNWSLYFLGALKIHWDTSKNDIATEVIPTKRLILDPDGWVDAKGIFHGEYVGEYKKFSKSKLLELFPSKKEEINGHIEGGKGTRVFVIEWTTKTDLFWTLNEEVVLDKTKNINWNWSGEVSIDNPDNEDEPTKQYVEGKNHFQEPMINYIFFSVFNLGKQPHDETGLIYQSIPMQDQINERLLQINKNVKRMNNSIVFNGAFYTKEQASQALTMFDQGGGIWAPNQEKSPGRIDEAVKLISIPAISGDVFQAMENGRTRLVGIFGTSGSTPGGIEKQDDVRGKIMAQQMDTSRIGGGITTYLEQLCDTWYNWQLQMMYVYYDQPHEIGAVGDSGAQEVVMMHNQDLTKKVMITVKEGSMIPKDPLSKRNEAVDLWSANAIDPISLYKALEFPDPYNQAKQLLTWQLIQKGAVPPTLMFQDFEAPMAGVAGAPGGPIPQEQPGTGGPAVSPPPAGPEAQPQQVEGAQPPVQQASQQIMQQVPIQ